MKHHLIIIPVLFINILFSQNFELNQHITSSSAVSVSNNQYKFSGTLGQSIVGERENANYIIFSGFWGNISHVLLGTDEGPMLPKEFLVSNPYPNPFNPTVVIDFAIPTPNKVRFKIYDLLGRTIFEHSEDYSSAGYYKFYWKGMSNKGLSVASGTYLVVITDGEKKFKQKITLLK